MYRLFQCNNTSCGSIHLHSTFTVLENSQPYFILLKTTLLFNSFTHFFLIFPLSSFPPPSVFGWQLKSDGSEYLCVSTVTLQQVHVFARPHICMWWCPLRLDLLTVECVRQAKWLSVSSSWWMKRGKLGSHYKPLTLRTMSTVTLHLS